MQPIGTAPIRYYTSSTSRETCSSSSGLSPLLLDVGIATALDWVLISFMKSVRCLASITLQIFSATTLMRTVEVTWSIHQSGRCGKPCNDTHITICATSRVAAWSAHLRAFCTRRASNTAHGPAEANMVASAAIRRSPPVVALPRS